MNANIFARTRAATTYKRYLLTALGFISIAKAKKAYKVRHSYEAYRRMENEFMNHKRDMEEVFAEPRKPLRRVNPPTPPAPEPAPQPAAAPAKKTKAPRKRVIKSKPAKEDEAAPVRGLSMQEQQQALKTLGLAAPIPKADLNKLFKKLAIVWHPDRWRPDSPYSKEEMTAKFADISKAYHGLMAMYA